MGLLTQPDTDSKIHGALFSKWLPLRHYCAAQIRTLWRFFHEQRSSDISAAECIIIVSKCIKEFYKVLIILIHFPPSLIIFIFNHR